MGGGNRAATTVTVQGIGKHLTNLSHGSTKRVGFKHTCISIRVKPKSDLTVRIIQSGQSVSTVFFGTRLL